MSRKIEVKEAKLKRERELSMMVKKQTRVKNDSQKRKV